MDLVAQEAETGSSFGEDALEYTLIGSLSEDTSVYFTGLNTTDPKSMTWLFSLDATHRFEYSDHELTVVHKTSVNDSKITNTVYEAYLLLRPADFLDIYVGKKRMNIGTGMTCTPGDSFNPESWFFDQKTGVRDVIVTVSPNSLLGISAGISLEQEIEIDSFTPELIRYAFQANLVVDRLQLLASFVYCPIRTFNPGVGLSLDLFGIILSAEGAVEFDSETWYIDGPAWRQHPAFTDPRFSGTAGARYECVTEDINMLVSAEYIYTGQSWTKDETEAWKNLNPSAMLAFRPPFFRNQHNIALRTMFSGWSRLGIGGTAIINCVDESVLLNTSVTFSPYDNIDLVANVLSGIGAPDSEWGSLTQTPFIPRPVTVVTFTARFHI
jgi:hypothetical protein